MKQVISYQQCDPRWGGIDYSTKGEKTDICESGCGTTSAAMILSTFLHRNISPAEISKWSLEHGYKALKQGTYYSFFQAVGRQYGVSAVQLNYKNLRKQPSEIVQSDVIERLSKGQLIVACMGKGLWTNNGHYIVLYDVDVAKDIAYVNDPASTNPQRTRGSWKRLKKEVKYYFAFENPQAGGGETMTKIKVKVGNQAIREVDGENKAGTTYVHINGQSVPIRAFCETLGIKVGWDSVQSCVTINV